MPPLVVPQPVPTVPSVPPPRHAQDGGGGALAATLLAVAVVAVALLMLFAPWRRSKLPRARASIRPGPDGDDADPEA